MSSEERFYLGATLVRNKFFSTQIYFFVEREEFFERIEISFFDP